jgi:hypothetical protein
MELGESSCARAGAVEKISPAPTALKKIAGRSHTPTAPPDILLLAFSSLPSPAIA